ncbi:DUF4124 domain-containing protein [Pseudomonas sp. SL4(2022)]|uniref:DUF4124 domain-containing protein n=1 Tax=Pseudomonas sp. SL4(2022) TaxID=2994661 RepID=UPI0022707532|nr:DUF4124 domain-containing protein [Pseudomonas sp. SL4(2022)]WAC43504.1 DUF4124 domain-containing protein [Pseudomonas sp. SL4(2022)]
MRGLHYAACCAILLCPLSTLGSTVYRCEDAKGHITFTRQGCPASHQQSLQQAYNPTPGSGKPVPLAKPQKSNHNSKKTDKQELAVVGVKEDACGNQLSSSERRAAIIKQQIRTGMSRADVESSLGRPDKVNEHNGQTRYIYQGKKGNKRNVSFDEAGCVKGKTKR